MADHIPPPTPEQFALLDDLAREMAAAHCGLQTRQSIALRAVLAYARLGARFVEEHEGERLNQGEAYDVCKTLERMAEKAGLGLPPAQEAERRG